MGKQAPKGAGLATEADEASSGRNRADLRRGYGRIEGGHALASRRRRGDCAPAYRNGPQGDDTAERITPIEGQLQWPHVRSERRSGVGSAPGARPRTAGESSLRLRGRSGEASRRTGALSLRYCAATALGRTKSLNRSRNTVLRILPVAVCGISSTKTTSSGIHQLAILPCMNRKISSLVAA